MGLRPPRASGSLSGWAGREGGGAVRGTGIHKSVTIEALAGQVAVARAFAGACSAPRTRAWTWRSC
jgi:hypothetical protein